MNIANIQTIIISVGLIVATLPVSAVDTLEIDSKKSKVELTIQNKPPGASKFEDICGVFKDFTGKVAIDRTTPSKNSVEIEVKTTSIDTGNKTRDDHLRNQDFFKVKEFPKMTFKSTKVSEHLWDGVTSGIVSGAIASIALYQYSAEMSEFEDY